MGRGRQTTVGLSTTGIFSGYFSETLEMRPLLLHSDMQSVVGFSMIAKKCVTWYDLEWPFRVEFYFCAGFADPECATFEK